MLRFPIAASLALCVLSLAHGQLTTPSAQVCDPISSRPLNSGPSQTDVPMHAAAGADAEPLQLAGLLGDTSYAKELQASLAPYAHQSSPDGSSALRPWPGTDNAAYAGAYQYGDDFIVLRPTSAAQQVTLDLPEGMWINYMTGAQVLGGQSVPMDASTGAAPLWVRGGVVIPRRTRGVYALRERKLYGSQDNCGAMCLYDVMPGFTGDVAKTAQDADGRTLTRTRSSLRIDGAPAQAIIRWRFAWVQDVRVNGSPVRPQESEEGYYIVVDHADSTLVEWTPRGYNTAWMERRRTTRR